MMIAKWLCGISLALLPAWTAAQERPITAPAHEHHEHAAPPSGEARQGMRGSREWTRYPLILPVMAPRGERGGNTLALKNLEAQTLDVYAPDMTRRQYPAVAEGTRVEPASPKSGNYYWLTARVESESRIEVASTATYFSNPGAAPTEMLKQRKHELEIVPLLLPREHGAYRESEKWRFLVRYAGQPLAGKKLTLETEFGSRIAYTSGADGVATVLFPYDFKPEEPGKGGGHHGGPRRAKFVLAAEHEDGGKHYLTAFNYSYSPDAERGRNLAAGLGFGAFGMLLAAPLLRRGKSNGEKSS
jgi:hypothetical protein